MTTAACRSCKFYRGLNREGGECTRFPPQVFLVPDSNVLRQKPGMVKRGIWPPVSAESFCGEFAPKLQLQS